MSEQKDSDEFFKQKIVKALEGVEDHFISEYFKNKEHDEVLVTINMPTFIQNRIPTPFAEYCFEEDMKTRMEKFSKELEHQLNLNGVYYGLKTNPIRIKMNLVFPENQSSAPSARIDEK